MLLCSLLLAACRPPPAGEPPAADEPPATPEAQLAPPLRGTRAWPAAVPTIYPDGALSLRALQLDPEPLLAGARAGELVRVRAIVQGPEPLEGEPLRTWCVDRAIDLQRLDLGLAVEPPLRIEPHTPIVLLAALERRSDEGRAMLLLRARAWSTDEGASWHTPSGEASSRPRETESAASPLLVRAAEVVPREHPDELARIRELLQRAALADEGELAEHYAHLALALAPDDVELWSTLAAIEHGYGQHEAHLAVLEAASRRELVELDGLWFEYGMLDVTIGEHEAAIPLLERAVALEPQRLAAHFYLATAHWLLGHHDASRSGYTRVLELAGPLATVTELRMIDTANARIRGGEMQDR